MDSLIEYILFEILGTILGWFYMFIRYRSTKERVAVLQEQYGGSYRKVIPKTIVYLTAIVLLFSLAILLMTW